MLNNFIRLSSFEVQLILLLTIFITLTFFSRKLLKKISLPTVLGPLFIGLIINYLISYDTFSFIPDFDIILSSFSNLGIILLLFLLGLKINLTFVKDMTKNSSIMALNAGIIPFTLGFFATSTFGYNIYQSLFVGICLSITAEEVSLSILKEANLVKKKIGKLILEAGIIGDIFEIYIIAILAIIMKSQNHNTEVFWFSMAAEFVGFTVLIILIRYYVIPIIFNMMGDHPKKHELLLGNLVILFLTTLSSELLNFGYFIGALASGILIKDMLIENEELYNEKHIVSVIETISFGFFEPIVFIWIGISINISAVFSNIWFGVVLTIIATVGKIFGSMMGNYFCKQSIKEGFLIGWALNARGSTELFAIIIAKNQNIIPVEIFNAIIFMALVTTVISPIIFKILVNSKMYSKMLNKN